MKIKYTNMYDIKKETLIIIFSAIILSIIDFYLVALNFDFKLLYMVTCK